MASHEFKYPALGIAINGMTFLLRAIIILCLAQTLSGCSAVTPLNYEDRLTIWQKNRDDGYRAECQNDISRATQCYLTALEEGSKFGQISAPSIVSLLDLAHIYELERQVDKSRNLYELAWSICEESDNDLAAGRSVAALPDGARLEAASELANCYRDQGITQKAEVLYQKGLAIVRALPFCQLGEQRIIADYARLLIQCGRQEEARQLILKFQRKGGLKSGKASMVSKIIPHLVHHQYLRDMTGVPGPNSSWLQYELAAESNREHYDFAKARKLAEMALREARKLGPDDMRLCRSLETMQSLCPSDFNYQQALLEENLGILEHNLGYGRLQTIACAQHLAEVYLKQKKPAKAEACLHNLLHQLHLKWPHGGLGVEQEQLRAQSSLCEALSQQGKTSEALAEYKKLLPRLETAPDSHILSNTFYHLADIYISDKNIEAADALCKQVLSVADRRRDSYLKASAWAKLAQCSTKRKDYKQAKDYYQKAVAIYDKDPWHAQGSCLARRYLAENYHAMGDFAAEKRAYDEAAKYVPRSDW